MGSRGAQWYSRPEQADQHHGFADFYQRFFGETPSQKTPDTGLTSIRVAKLGNAYTGQPPQRNRSSMLRSAYPPQGEPPRFSRCAARSGRQATPIDSGIIRRRNGSERRGSTYRSSKNPFDWIIAVHLNRASHPTASQSEPSVGRRRARRPRTRPRCCRPAWRPRSATARACRDWSSPRRSPR